MATPIITVTDRGGYRVVVVGPRDYERLVEGRDAQMGGPVKVDWMSRRTYGYSPTGGLAEAPGRGYQPVRLALGPAAYAVDIDRGVAIEIARGNDDGWESVTTPERPRLSERWQRAFSAIARRGG